MNNINSIGKKVNMENNSETKKVLPFEYNLNKESYDKFLENVEKSDFKEAPTRYMAELRLVQNLISCAEKYKMQDELNILSERQRTINDKLAEMGIKVND